MFRNTHWVGPDPEQTCEPVDEAHPIEAALGELRRAARDLAFAEAAEMIAQNRIAVIDGMIATCEADAARSGGADAGALGEAAASLREERASLAATLPLECAFRADQRDHACARILAVQARLQEWLGDPARSETAFNPNIAPDEAVIMVQEAVARSPDEIAASARAEARARLYEVSAGEALDIAPIAPPEQAHCAAWLAGRLVARAQGLRREA